MTTTMPTSWRRIGVVAAGTLASVMAADVPAAPSVSDGGRRPNVVMIVLDDLNDWVGPLKGHPQVVTPAMDRLARQGLTFEYAYCQAPICNPSRNSFLTGLHPSTTGIYHNPKPSFVDVEGLKSLVSLPRLMRSNGYQTYTIGKVYHGTPEKADVWSGTLSKVREEEQAVAPAITQVPGIYEYGWPAKDGPAYGEAVPVASLLAKPAQGPVFVMLGLHQPHVPLVSPKRYFDLYPAPERILLPERRTDDLDDLPAMGRQLATGKLSDEITTALSKGTAYQEVVRAYMASVSWGDACVGRVLDAIEQGPHRDNTIVIVFGDNGWHLGEKQHWKKKTLWDESARVPLFIRAPGATAAGSRCRSPVGLIDLYPTLVSLCRLDGAPLLEGRDLSPLLSDPGREWPHAVRTTAGLGNHRISKEQWRYIRYSDGGEELYDIRADPQEYVNLAGQRNLAVLKAGLAACLPAREAPALGTEGKGE